MVSYGFAIINMITMEPQAQKYAVTLCHKFVAVRQESAFVPSPGTGW
jgi:hypothetical protein